MASSNARRSSPGTTEGILETDMPMTYSWYEVYKAAVLETDWTKMQERSTPGIRGYVCAVAGRVRCVLCGTRLLSGDSYDRSLATYLQDHLAGALQAIELLKAMRDHHAGELLGESAPELMVEIEVDRGALEFLAARDSRQIGALAHLALVAPDDYRLRDANFDQLVARAESQHAMVDEQRLACARSALCPAAE